jgi:hypothetical protein
MANPAYAKRVYSLQNQIVLEQAQPLLIEAKAKYDGIRSKVDKKYFVPSVGRKAIAKRTDGELRDIYTHYISNGLFEAFLVNSLSRFEAFLADVLFHFLMRYPLRITEKVPGVRACPDIAVKDLVTSSNWWT